MVYIPEQDDAKARTSRGSSRCAAMLFVILAGSVLIRNTGFFCGHGAGSEKKGNRKAIQLLSAGD